MAISFPASLEDIFDRFPIQTAGLELTEAYEMNQTGAGDVIVADLGARLWKMDVTIRPGSYRDMERVRNRLNMLRQASRPLFVTPVPGKFPRDDPDGSKLATAEPTLAALAGNRRDLRLEGLPASFWLSDGDFISLEYGENPVRYGFFQIIMSNQSQGGRTVEVYPNVPQGVVLGQPVRLIRPFFKAIIMPGSARLGETGQQYTRGISFTVQQTLR